jgi:hypothetical protein
MIKRLIWETSVGIVLTSVHALHVDVSLVLLLLQVHQTTHSFVSNLEDSKVMVSIVLLLVLKDIITILEIHYFTINII